MTSEYRAVVFRTSTIRISKHSSQAKSAAKSTDFVQLLRTLGSSLRWWSILPEMVRLHLAVSKIDQVLFLRFL